MVFQEITCEECGNDTFNVYTEWETVELACEECETERTIYR